MKIITIFHVIFQSYRSKNWLKYDNIIIKFINGWYCEQNKKCIVIYFNEYYLYLPAKIKK